MNQINGPVIPLPVPFLKDLTIDHESLSNYVAFLADNGIKNVMTTVGTSRYNLLTWEECKAVNTTVAKAAKKNKIQSIIANPPFGDLNKALEFTRHTESIGADYFLAYFPDRHYGEDNTFSFFEAISENLQSTKGLIHEMPMRNGLGGGQVRYSLTLIQRILQLDQFVGMKEEALDPEYSNQILDNLGGKCEIVGAGGGMSRYLYRDFDRGSTAFLGGIGNFVPQLEINFYNDMQSGKRENAEEIVTAIEAKYFEVVISKGWHPTLKTSLHLMGLMPEYERSPMKKVPREEVDEIKTFLQKQNWM